MTRRPPFPQLRRGSSRGAALLEYALLLGLVAVVAIGSVSVLGGKVHETFDTVGSQLSDLDLVHAGEETASGEPVMVGPSLHAPDTWRDERSCRTRTASARLNVEVGPSEPAPYNAYDCIIASGGNGWLEIRDVEAPHIEMRNASGSQMIAWVSGNTAISGRVATITTNLTGLYDISHSPGYEVHLHIERDFDDVVFVEQYGYASIALAANPTANRILFKTSTGSIDNVDGPSAEWVMFNDRVMSYAEVIAMVP